MALRRAGLAGDGLRLVVVAAAYVVGARLGLELAIVNGQVTPVWPPTGIALVAILIFGARVWPALARPAGRRRAPDPRGAGRDGDRRHDRKPRACFVGASRSKLLPPDVGGLVDG